MLVNNYTILNVLDISKSYVKKWLEKVTSKCRSDKVTVSNDEEFVFVGLQGIPHQFQNCNFVLSSACVPGKLEVHFGASLSFNGLKFNFYQIIFF
jgi:hypothetical protein